MSNLAILGGPKTIDKMPPHFVWPIITNKVKEAVLKQMDQSVSIYNKSGIFKEFEDRFAQYHDRKYGLLNNSGTSSIYAMFEGIGLQPGDEVICPTYTFYATASPLILIGAKPVFCDCLNDGNIDPLQIKNKITPKTKAVIVTHMWGVPCDMQEIKSICDEYSIKLLEDCSHAHGAEVGNQKVGTFGDAAAWSLQGQKTITGGEGGILLTDDEDIYTRAQLLGHYNKRCVQEIDQNHPLYEFAITGFGQKFRAHPFAIAMANEQFDHLDNWINTRNQYAQKMISAWNSIDFLEMPQINNKKPSWYAFVVKYKVNNALGLPIDKFHKILQAEGLVEADIPKSTRPIHSYPLFQKPHLIKPALYKPDDGENSVGQYPVAEDFYSSAIKFPVWASDTPEDANMVKDYIDGVLKVAHAIKRDIRELLEI